MKPRADTAVDTMRSRPSQSIPVMSNGSASTLIFFWIGVDIGLTHGQQIDRQLQHRAIGFEDQVPDARQRVFDRGEQADIERAGRLQVERLRHRRAIFSNRTIEARRSSTICAIFVRGISMRKARAPPFVTRRPKASSPRIVSL